jgi:hypothetical protein
MSSPSKTSYSVIVLGDAETVGLSDLGEKAAEQGAVITEAFAFAPGEAVSHDDLTEVEAVVAALSRAIATRADIWVPFPLADLGREQHVRRISLVLQRHGLNMLMGRELNPCTQDGGFSEIDFALRAEVRAVDGLDCAALAVSGAATLAEEIEQALRRTDSPRRTSSIAPPDQQGAARKSDAGERFYGTGDVAKFFGKSVQWVYRGLRTNVFTRADGSPIEPIRTAGNRGKRGFTVPMLRDIARSCYRRGTLGEGEYLDLLVVLARAEQE